MMNITLSIDDKNPSFDEFAALSGQGDSTGWKFNRDELELREQHQTLTDAFLLLTSMPEDAMERDDNLPQERIHECCPVRDEHIPNDQLARDLLKPDSEKGYKSFSSAEALFFDLNN